MRCWSNSLEPQGYTCFDMGISDDPIDDQERDVRNWFLEGGLELLDPPPQKDGGRFLWGIVVPDGMTGQRFAVFRPSDRDRIDLQTVLELNDEMRNRFSKMKRSRDDLIFDLVSLLLKHPVEFGLEDLPDLRRVRLIQHIYFDAWSKDLFWQRMMLLANAARDAAATLSRRLGDPSQLSVTANTIN